MRTNFDLPIYPGANDRRQERADRAFVDGFGSFLLKQKVGEPLTAPSVEVQNLAIFLKTTRKHRGLTVAKLAQRAGVADETIFALELGTLTVNEIDEMWLVRLARALHEKPNTLRAILGLPNTPKERAPSRVFEWYRRYHLGVLVIGDAAMLALAFWLAYIVRFQIAGRMIPAWNEPRLDYLMFGGAAIVVMLGIFWIAQLYDYQLLTNDSVEYPNVIYACFFGALAMIFLGFFVAPFGDMMSRGWVAAAWTFSILLVSGSRYVVRKIWHRLAINGYPLAQVLILGTEAESLQLYRRLMESQRSVLEVVGFVDIRGKRPSGNKWPLPAPQGLPLLDVGVDKLQQVLLRHRIDEVIIVSELKRVDFANVLYVADQENVRVRALLHSDEMFSRRRSGSLGLAHTPLVMVNSLSLNPFHKTVKRGFDLVVAGLGLLAFSPLWALVAVHCMLDRVPLLDGDEIIGMDEKPFRMFRFNVYGDESWFGQFLRNTRLCKVPRLLNVLRGEMSIVGPEALPASRKDLLKKYEFMPLTLRVRPGLTGTWCIVDREEQTVIEKIRLDMYYLSHYSFLKDLDIFFIRTVPKFPGVLAGGIQAPKLVEEKASNGSYQTPASAT